MLVDGVRVNALQRANTVNLRRRKNVDFLEKPNRTGLYLEYDQHCHEMAKKYGYDGVYVELVHTTFLRDVLLRYGYTRVNIRGLYGIFEYNYWRSVEKDERRF